MMDLLYVIKWDYALQKTQAIWLYNICSIISWKKEDNYYTYTKNYIVINMEKKRKQKKEKSKRVYFWILRVSENKKALKECSTKLMIKD